MTFTVMASNPATKEIGLATTTLTINFGRMFPHQHNLLPEWSERGLICAAQASIHPHNAHKMIELWDQGQSFGEIEQALSRSDPYWTWRQLGAVTGAGEVYVYTGKDAWDHASHIVGDGWLAMGNFMNGPVPVQAMAEVVDSGRDLPLDERLMRALEAGRDAGGQASPETGHVPELFATMQVYNGRQPWAAVDLRVDFDVHAVAKLRRLLTQTRRMDTVFQTFFEDPGAVFDSGAYGVVFEMLDAQV